MRVVSRREERERGDRVEPLRAHHLGGFARDRDVMAHRDVEEPGVVARLGDATMSSTRAPSRSHGDDVRSESACTGSCIPYASTPSGTIETGPSERHPGQTTDCISLYACRPNTPPSRPTPLYFMPPNGALWLRCVVLMPTLPARSRLLDAERAVGVGAEHVVVEAEVGAVRDRDAFVLVVERDRDDHRAEDLLLHDRMSGPAARDQRRRDVVAACRASRAARRRRRPRRLRRDPTRRSPRSRSRCAAVMTGPTTVSGSYGSPTFRTFAIFARPSTTGS